MRDDSDNKDAYDPDEATAEERVQGAVQPNDNGKVEQRRVIRNRPRLEVAELPNATCSNDTEQRWAILDRPWRKTTSTKDSKYNYFICD